MITTITAIVSVIVKIVTPCFNGLAILGGPYIGIVHVVPAYFYLYIAVYFLIPIEKMKPCMQQMLLMTT